MNDDEITLNGQDVQVTNDDAADELDHDLADDVDATIETLGELISIDSETTMTTPFGEMTEEDLLGLIRPSLWQWVGSHRETALRVIGLLHRTTGDLIEKHTDRDPTELAQEAKSEL